jgi:uncharacterized membrane protein (DUF4010 family)
MDATTGVWRILVAALCGAAIGVERQWSGHAVGPTARIGGIRTFTLLGALAGIGGWLWALGFGPLGVTLLAGGAALVIAAYAAASRHDVDGTTEVAALVTLAAGSLAGLGHLGLASGITSVMCLLLVEKTRLHASVARLDDAGIKAGIRFAVMALVVLPLLPQGPYGPWGGIRPRELWMLVLFFSGLSFLGFIARRVVGPKHGYPLAGILGGLVSSTNVTFAFARESRARPSAAGPLAFGVMAASTVLIVRVLLATSVLNAHLMTALLPYLAPAFLIGAVLTAWGWRRLKSPTEKIPEPGNPLELRSALQMAALFQGVLFLVHIAQSTWGDLGLVVSGALLGLTDMDALTISMARSASEPSAVLTAAQAISIGVVSNSVLKSAVSVAIGRGAVRTLAAAGLLAMGIAIAASLWFYR